MSEANELLPEVERPLADGSITYALSRSLVTIAEPGSGAAEAIRALRTHVMAQHVEQGRRALAVCAPTEGVGCTYVATNLAVSMAQIGIKTLLIDGNLRQPGVEPLMRSNAASSGLAQCLAAELVNVSPFVQSEVLPNLSVMYAGSSASNPQELLASERFEALMNVCLRDYDFTIVDTPPANMCSDAGRIGRVLGYCMVVARRNQSRVDDVKTIVNQLQGDHAKVIGTVLNEF